MRYRLAASLTVLIASGCSAPRVNPSFDVTASDARADLRRMADEPALAARPIVFVSGYGDPGFVALELSNRFRKLLLPGTKIITADAGFTFSMQGARDRLLGRVEEALPDNDKEFTPEVDVVAMSMGGLVARYAAAPRADGDPGKRLRIARLFTISSPHRGARLAALPSIESRITDMRSGSEFLCRLNDPACTDYPIIPYARLNDFIVGAENTAPPGRTPWWVDTPAFQPAHLLGHSDPRILADIARRLRGESPFTHDPPAPLPTGS
jgi:pimeloyl-ACP methyl ester carboxylesterase